MKSRTKCIHIFISCFFLVTVIPRIMPPLKSETKYKSSVFAIFDTEGMFSHYNPSFKINLHATFVGSFFVPE